MSVYLLRQGSRSLDNTTILKVFRNHKDNLSRYGNEVAMRINWNDDFIKKLEEAEKIHFECVKTAEKVLEALAGEETEGSTEKEISKRARVRRQRFIKALRKLVQIKSIVRLGSGVRFDPYRYKYAEEPPKSPKTTELTAGTTNDKTPKTPSFEPSIERRTVKK